MVVAECWRKGSGELLLHGDRIVILQEENSTVGGWW